MKKTQYRQIDDTTYIVTLPKVYAANIGRQKAWCAMSMRLKNTGERVASVAKVTPTAYRVRVHKVCPTCQK